MTGTDIPQAPLDGPAFDRLLAELRRKLHRYCARMTGSVVDGEDVLQDAMIKAIEAFPTAGTIENPSIRLATRTGGVCNLCNVAGVADVARGLARERGRSTARKSRVTH